MVMTAQQVKRLISEYDGKPKAVADQYGLQLLLQGKSSATWGFRYQLHGKRKTIGLGPVASLTLADARAKAFVLWQGVKQGVDPVAVKAAEAAKKIPTFAQVAEDFITQRTSFWKNPKTGPQWRSSLSSYVFPTIGDLPVNEIETKHVMAALTPIWGRIPETASRLRSRIELVLDAASALGHRDGLNPARWQGHLNRLLSIRAKGAKKHMAAMPYADAPMFFQKLITTRGSTSSLALAFTILSACRTNEVLGMKCDEVDLTKGVWTIPANRMKAGREHRVPLTPPMVRILEGSLSKVGFVFEGARSGSPLSSMAMLMALRKLGHGDVTVHGFRSTFRDWASEETSHSHAVCEMALAHSIGNAVEAAYRRGDLFEKRISLMTDWGNYLLSSVS